MDTTRPADLLIADQRVFAGAVREFWEVRGRQGARGSAWDRGARSAVAVQEPHFPVFPEFRGASYVQRYELFCRRLVLERHYSAACFLVSDPQSAESLDNYDEPAADLSADSFLSQLLRHVRR